MGHAWAISIMCIYYIVRSQSKAVMEVCATFPDPPAGLTAIAVMGLGVSGLLACAEAATRVPHAPRRRGLVPFSQLPGGVCIWGVGPAVTASFWCIILYIHGPLMSPDITSVSDMNALLSSLVPATNEKLHRRIPESHGDCEALWQHRVDIGEVLYEGPGVPRGGQRCTGNEPIAHMSQTRGSRTVNTTASWATGLNTLEIMDWRLLPPEDVTVSPQMWNMSVRGKFTDLHVWIKVLLGDKEWVNDYMCCDKSFHFTIQASARCVQGRGFERVRLHVLHMDAIDFKHEEQYEGGQGDSTSIAWDYGRFGVVEKALSNFMTLNTGKLLMKNSDGSIVDVLSSASGVLEDIVMLNTGHHCPYHI